MPTERKPDQVLDTKGTLCPLPVIESKRAMAKLTRGQVLSILATDPGAMADIPAWARSTGNRLLQASEDRGIYTFLVEKTEQS